MSTNLPPPASIFSTSKGYDESSSPSSPHTPKHEVRLYGLNQAVTTDSLVNFFSAKTHVHGVLLHQNEFGNGLQWAQVWVGSEDEVQKCLDLRTHLAPSGITLSRAPSTLLSSSQGLPTPDRDTSAPPLEIRAPPTPQSLPPGVRPDLSAGLGYRHIDPQGPLPRNLYVMGLPLDLTQNQFKALFASYGMVEHSTLLSQLDGMGRRRGFILMSTHREAVEAMQAMNGSWVDGFQIDVSWALVQREGKQYGSHAYGSLPNRVIHPPSMPVRREMSDDCSVIVENLDEKYFPNAGTIREIFSHFGPVTRVTVLSMSPFQALIQFEHEVSAMALLNADGLSLGGRPITTRRYRTSTPASSSPPSGRITFDPFGPDLCSRFTGLNFNLKSSSNHLNADSEPFVPLAWKANNTPDVKNTNKDDPHPQSDSSNNSRTNSESTRTSVDNNTSKATSKIAPLQGKDRWQIAPNWCERFHNTLY
nr:uncharacterized protein CI109_006270 [Kwoniella shandongensis]KAA5525371.1 hypothetical protein CI109_006270 [Kwoniella shandongensis]